MSLLLRRLTWPIRRSPLNCLTTASNYEKPENGLFKQLKKVLIERALGAELSSHLSYEKGDPAGAAPVMPADERALTSGMLSKMVSMW